MSRRMLKTAPAAFAHATTNTVLTCPTNHKYEVLASYIELNGVGAQNLSAFLHDVANALSRVMTKIAVPANTYIDQTLYGPVVLDPGEKFDLRVAGGVAAAWVGWVVYIDVDFT